VILSVNSTHGSCKRQCCRGDQQCPCHSALLSNRFRSVLIRYRDRAFVARRRNHRLERPQVWLRLARQGFQLEIHVVAEALELNISPMCNFRCRRPSRALKRDMLKRQFAVFTGNDPNFRNSAWMRLHQHFRHRFQCGTIFLAYDNGERLARLCRLLQLDVGLIFPEEKRAPEKAAKSPPKLSCNPKGVSPP
jgi:hypothetical protein